VVFLEILSNPKYLKSNLKSKNSKQSPRK